MKALDFLRKLVWLDGKPLLPRMEPYRRRTFEQFFDESDADGRPRYNLGLFGRAKKNWKTADLVLACWFAVLSDSPAGAQVYVIANDADQAGDDLALAKKLRAVNPALEEHTRVTRNVIERRDGGGFIEILPAQDALGAHGKTFRLLAVDEIHGYRNWDVLEALAPDPTRPDAQTWITSYASLRHAPGAPLFDLTRIAKAGTDPRMLFSWYAADFTTDLAFTNKTPEERANPSMASWNNPNYLAQQQRRLPAHKYRRLHLNLPGLPEGSAFQPDPIFNAIERGVTVRPPEPRVEYVGALDMSGGSSDDAVLAIGHADATGRAVIDCVIDQGQRPPFDPNKAVERFVRQLRTYGIQQVVGDRYAGTTFANQFLDAGIAYLPSSESASEAYEAFEPRLNAGEVRLLDLEKVEQQLLGLIWRGGRIDHPNGGHDDHACAVALVVHELLDGPRAGGVATMPTERQRDRARVLERLQLRGSALGPHSQECSCALCMCEPPPEAELLVIDPDYDPYSEARLRAEFGPDD